MTTTTTRTARPVRPRRSVGSRIGSVLLTLAAIGGSICIVLVILAFAFHITLTMFKTGSMSPTIPEGSVAIVKQIPASQIRVGEVVTVNRANGELPISHRVTSITGTGPVRTITMKGDANPVPDPAPYTVSTVRLVLFSVPGLAYFIVWLSNPIVLGLIALGVAALVTWAFWPRHGSPRAGRRRTNGSGAQHSVLTVPAIVLVAGLSAVLATTGAAQRADAAPVDVVTTGKVITLDAIGDPDLMGDLQPGVPALWQVGVSAHSSDPGTIKLTLSSDGSLAVNPSGLQVTVSACAQQWDGDTCATGGSTVLAAQPLSGIPNGTSLGSMRSTTQRWLLVSAEVPSAASVPSGTADVRVTAKGVGDEVSAPGHGHGGSGGSGGSSGSGGAFGSGGNPLAYTGTDAAPAIAFALAAIALGLAIAATARLLRRRSDRMPS